jgi:hypothetical protein
VIVSRNTLKIPKKRSKTYWRSDVVEYMHWLSQPGSPHLRGTTSGTGTVISAEPDRIVIESGANSKPRSRDLTLCMLAHVQVLVKLLEGIAAARKGGLTGTILVPTMAQALREGNQQH